MVIDTRALIRTGRTRGTCYNAADALGVCRGKPITQRGLAATRRPRN